MNVRSKQLTDRSDFVAVCIVLIVVVVTFGLLPPFAASASIVENRFIQLETARTGATGYQKVGFRITDFSQPLGSIRIQYCANGPIIGTPCDPPTGLSADDASIESQDGETGFTIHADSDDNNVILTRLPILPVASDLEYELGNIRNPDALGTFYARVFTYPTSDATGSHIQAGGIALSTALDVEIESEVPPYLTFCASVSFTGLNCGTSSGFFINLGEFSAFSTTTATSEIIIATNAANGYTSRVNGSTLTSGNDVIPALPVRTASQAGTSQFGINLRNNSNPNVGANPVGPGTANPTVNYNTVNQFRFNSNEPIVTSSIPSDTRKFTISYITNIDTEQAPGIYTTTISFVTLGNF